MSWAKLDDRYDDHPKVRQAWREHPATVGVHAMAITHSARYGTDGLVAAAWLRDLMPHWAQRKKVLAILVSAGLFDAVGDGSYRVHDFLDYNPSRLSRAKLSSAAREAALVRWSAERTANRTAPTDADGKRLLSETQCPSRPDPTRPQLQQQGIALRAVDARASLGLSLPPPAEERRQLAAYVSSVLQGGLDSLTSDDRGRDPSAAAVLRVLGSASERQAHDAAWEARSIAQAQNRAPNIVGLFAQRLAVAQPEEEVS